MKKYPFVKQDGIKDCGVASLLMIIKYYKGDYPLEMLREMTNTDKNGVTAYDLVETSKKLGFSSKGIKICFDDIKKENITFPCIAYTLIDNSYQHFVVIYEINYKKNYILVADPSKSILKMSLSEFKNIFQNIIIVCLPVKNVPRIKQFDYIKEIIITFLKTKKNLFIAVFIINFIMLFLEILSSFQLKLGIDNLNNKNALFFLFIIFIIIQIFKIGVNFLKNKMVVNLIQNLDFKLTSEIFKKIIFLPYNYYRNRTTGEIISRFNDLKTICDFITKIVLIFLIDFILALSILFIIFMINNMIFVLCLFITLLYFLIIKTMKKQIIFLFNKSKNCYEKVNSYVVEVVNGFETIKGINIESEVFKNFLERKIHLLKNEHKLHNSENIEILFQNIVNYLSTTVFIFSGLYMIYLNIMTLSDFILIFTLFNYYSDSVRSIFELSQDYKEAKVCYKRINNCLIDKNINGLEEVTFNKIEIKNLNYFQGLNQILFNINYKIEYKDKVLLTGNSGSGKSSFLKVLKNYYNIEQNQVLIDNCDINNINEKSLKKINYISQNEILFNDTLYNNIILNRNISLEKYNKIIKLCSIDEIINKLPLGENTIIEENGFNISGGEKQRIILARTILNEPKVLLIDEGLNQVDIVLERKILEKLFEYLREVIIIVVSHRKENYDLFNKKIIIKNGILEEM